MHQRGASSVVTVGRGTSLDATHDVDIGGYVVGIARDLGPRIVSCRRAGGASMFAQLPGEGIQTDSGWFSFVGGHRLWVAPEVPELTYLPDDRPPTIDETSTGVSITEPEGGQPIIRRIDIDAADDRLIVTHTVRNASEDVLVVAPWAITQFAVGGTAVVPLAREGRDPLGLQASDVVVRWPYTRLDAPELTYHDDWVGVTASDRRQRLKIGTTNPRGWLAYQLGGQTFVKSTLPADDGSGHADLGATAQCFRDHRFLELETLGPLTELRPGASVDHVEVWALLAGHPPPDDIDGEVAR